MHRYFCYLALFVFFFLSIRVSGETPLPQRPDPIRFVNDYTGMISPQQLEQLETEVGKYSRTGHYEMIMMIIERTQAGDLDGYCKKIMAQWQIGKKDHGRGAIILIAMAEMHGHIYVSGPLQGIISANACFQIINRVLYPAFNQHHYFEGLQATAHALAVNLVPLNELKEVGDEKNHYRKILVEIALILLAGAGAYFLFFHKKR